MIGFLNDRCSEIESDNSLCSFLEQSKTVIGSGNQVATNGMMVIVTYGIVQIEKSNKNVIHTFELN